MKLIAVLLFSLISLGSIEAFGSEDSRITGRLMRSDNGAVILGDDGSVYHVPDVSRGFLDRHAGRRVTLVGNAGLLTGSNDDRRVIMVDEIVVTAPAERNGDAGTEAAEAAQLIIPPLIPPLP
jgi:hypothetical protein